MPGKMRPVPIVGGAYSDDATSWTDQDCVNWLPVAAEGEGTRSPAILRTPPGLQEFSSVPDVRRQRGGYVAEGRLLFVADTTLYQQMPNGSIRTIGTVPGTGRVVFTHNKIGSDIEVFIGAGSWGAIYSSDADTLTQITDDGFHGAKSVGYIGHLFLAVDVSGREFQNSALDDGSSWNALETYQGESKPDRIVSLAVANGEVVLLNERSLDHFAYTGEVNALFQNKLIPIDRGCASPYAVSLLDNALFFPGDDGSAYEKRGYELRRISTHAIEQAWSECDLSKAYSFVWEDRGHKVWYITFPDGHTWGYDVASRQWHRRQSEGMDRWRLAWLAKWNGDWYGGEYNSGRVFRLSWDYVLEGANRMRRSRTSGVLHDNQNRLRLHTAEILVEAFGEATTATSALSLVFDTEQQVVTDTPTNLTIGGGLPDGAVGDAVNFQYRTIGGSDPVTFAVTAGALPAGVTLNAATGALTGTYTTAEHDNAWTMTATDADGNTATLVEAQYVMDMTGDPPDATTESAYSYTLVGTEGTSPYTFAKTAGTLNSGLALSSAGVLSAATPTAATSSFSVTMTDAADVTQTKAYTVVISNLAAWMAVGGGGKLATSPDADTWTDRTTGTALALRGLAYGGGVYCAVGDNAGGTHVIITSPTGVTWTSRTSVVTCDTLRGVAYGASLFVCVGSSGGLTDGKIQTSPDGVTWTSRTAPAGCGPLHAIAFGNNKFVAVANNTGKIIYSADGINWTAVSVGSSLDAVTYANSMFMAVGALGQTYTSTDGVTWATRTGSLAGNTFYSVAGGNSVWIAGTNSAGSADGIYRSTNNGDTWTRVQVGGFHYSAAYGAGTFVTGATGGDGYFSTDDGATFTQSAMHGSAVDNYALLYTG